MVMLVLFISKADGRLGGGGESKQINKTLNFMHYYNIIVISIPQKLCTVSIMVLYHIKYYLILVVFF